MAFSIFVIGRIIPKGKRSYPKVRKRCGRWPVLKFLYDANLRHVESSLRCHRKYKIGRIKVDLGFIIFIYLHVLIGSRMGFRLVPKSATLNDPERRTYDDCRPALWGRSASCTVCHIVLDKYPVRIKSMNTPSHAFQ